MNDHEPSAPELLAQAATAWRSGDLAGTEAALRHLLALEPEAVGHKAGIYEIAIVHAGRGALDDAERLLTDALAWPETAPSARIALGVVLNNLGRTAEAETHLRRALDETPGNVPALTNLGALLLGSGRAEEAYARLERAVEIDPGNVRALNNLALAASASGRVIEPIAVLERALRLSPGDGEVRLNLGKALREAGRIDRALAVYREALKDAPDDLGLIGNYLYCLGFSADLTPRAVAEEHLRLGRAFLHDAAPLPRRATRDRLRIGYMSPDFRAHSVSYFIAPVLAHHDRTAFEIVCYSDVSSDDDRTVLLRADADLWRDTRSLSDEALAEIVRADGIDILIDLAGHTAHNRLGVLARRAAPLQGTWLGYGGATGVPGVDFRIADPIVEPPDDPVAALGEAVARLPGAFLCYAPPPDAPAPALPAADAPPTFVSFNNAAKLNDRTLALWGRVLSAAPQSRLLLKSWQFADPTFVAEFAARFTTAGGDTNRLETIGHMADPADHFLAYRRGHVALDPLPYNGATTTAEALWMGLPVIARRGDRMTARFGETILTACGLGELIAPDDDAYVALAADLIGDLPRLAELRGGLRARLRGGRFCDGATFTRSLEALYHSLWKQAAR